MRRELRTIGRATVSGDPVSLRMSVGVHSGLFNFFLVGDSHREFVVTGPAALRESTVAGALEAEHRRVTVAFVHFDGTDALIAQAGPEETARHLEVVMGDAQRAADRQGIAFLGTDIDRDGGKIILTTGAPTTSGDDEHRMLMALREIVDGEHALPLRVGVNRGHVFAGDIGPP